MTTNSHWKFWQQPTVELLSEPVRRRLAADHGVSEQASGGLRMIRRQGRYAERKVTYFRVVDPEAVRQAGVDLRAFGDLDAHQPLHLHTGHIERDGQIVLNRSARGTLHDGERAD